MNTAASLEFRISEIIREKILINCSREVPHLSAVLVERIRETDKKYKIQSYKIGYLRTPNKISLENPVVEYTDFNDNVMYEIIKIAA